MQCVVVCFSVSQCVAVCYSVWQFVAVFYNVLQGHTKQTLFLLCVAVCCSVLRCGAVCCSVVQCVAVCCSVSQCVAVCCSMLQCVTGANQADALFTSCCAAYCSVMQCGAVWCSALQCISACCSVLRCAAAANQAETLFTGPLSRSRVARVCTMRRVKSNSWIEFSNGTRGTVRKRGRERLKGAEGKSTTLDTRACGYLRPKQTRRSTLTHKS